MHRRGGKCPHEEKYLNRLHSGEHHSQLLISRSCFQSVDSAVDPWRCGLLEATAMASSGSRAMWLLVCALAICQVVSARSLLQTSKASDVVQAFKEITTLSDNLRIEVQKINLINAPLQGYKISEGFGGIITRIAAEVKGDGGSIQFGNADAKLVVDALTTFVQVHQALLNVVIGKHGLLTLIPFFEPIRVSLVELERTVDAFAFQLIAMISETQKPAATQQFGSLSVTLKVAISTYEQPL